MSSSADRALLSFSIHHSAYDYRDYLMYDWIMRSKIVNLWIHIWQDLISHALFSFFAEIGRKEDECRDALRSGWKTS